MPDLDQSAKTEQPTVKRRQEAFAKGQFAQCPEIGVTLVLAAAFIMIVFTAREKAGEMGQLAVAILGNLSGFEFTEVGVVSEVRRLLTAAFYLLLPFLSACTIAALSAGGFQTGFRLTPKMLEGRLDKLNPASGIKRILSTRGLVQFAVDLAKFLAIGTLLYGIIREVMADPIFHLPVPVKYLGEFIHQTTLMMLIRLIGAIGLIAIIHYLYQRMRTQKDLMMTREEVKEERKSTEIDPKVRSEQRRIALRIMQKQMLGAVPTADVVVTNPTHYAVAMKYERDRDPAPMVVAKGEHLFARRIIAIAEQHGVPRVENKPVARLLYRAGQVGEAIPVELYQVVAQILASVYKAHRYYFHRLSARRLNA